MNSVYVFYSRISAPLPGNHYGHLLSLLPGDLQRKNARFVHWTDRQLHLAGKLLLKDALQQFGFPANCLHYLQYDQYGRPYISGDIDFNISHSGRYVLCTIAQQAKLGIDIEEIRPVALADFENVMTAGQWEHINRSHNPLRSFYTYWTIKESVIKADSRGLSIPLTDIIIDANAAQYDGKTWLLRELHIDDNYCACIATDKHFDSISIQHRPVLSLSMNRP